jgi:rare lipoprotein A
VASARRKSPYAPAQEDPGKRGNYVAGGLYAPHERDSVPDELPDVDAIPEPEVTNEPRSSVGNRKVYSVLGKKYEVLDNAEGLCRDQAPPRTTARSSTAVVPRTSRSTTCTPSALRTRPCRCPASRASPTSTMASRWSCASTIAAHSIPDALIDLSYAAAAKLGYVSKGNRPASKCVR